MLLSLDSKLLQNLLFVLATVLLTFDAATQLLTFNADTVLLCTSTSIDIYIQFITQRCEGVILGVRLEDLSVILFSKKQQLEKMCMNL